MKRYPTPVIRLKRDVSSAMILKKVRYETPMERRETPKSMIECKDCLLFEKNAGGDIKDYKFTKCDKCREETIIPANKYTGKLFQSMKQLP